MGILLDEPKYPVIDRNPSAGTTVGNFNFSDYLKITALTAGSLPVGYLAGNQPPSHLPAHSEVCTFCCLSV